MHPLEARRAEACISISPPVVMVTICTRSVYLAGNWCRKVKEEMFAEVFTTKKMFTEVFTAGEMFTVVFTAEEMFT